MELEKTEDMKTTLRTATAEMNIEGANTSRSELPQKKAIIGTDKIVCRLRITVVVDKNEEESLSKTMTIKVVLNSFLVIIYGI